MGNTIDLLKQLIESYFAEVRKTGEENLPVNYEISDLVITSSKIVANVVITGAQLSSFVGLRRIERLEPKI